jgi:hypothetical protein
LSSIASDESNHFEFLEVCNIWFFFPFALLICVQSSLTSFGGSPITGCSFDFSSVLTDVNTMLDVARVVENVGVGAFLGGATLVTDTVLLDSAATILTVEARHQTILNVLNLGSAIPQSFDIPLAPEEVLAIAGPFISGCDLGIPGKCSSILDLATLFADGNTFKRILRLMSPTPETSLLAHSCHSLRLQSMAPLT